MLAILTSSVAAVKALVDRGRGALDLALVNAEGKTALEMARGHGGVGGVVVACLEGAAGGGGEGKQPVVGATGAGAVV